MKLLKTILFTASITFLHAQDVKSTDKICHVINNINVNNSSVYSQQEIQETTSQYLNKCLGVKEISELISKLTNKYLVDGYITSRVGIKKQNLSLGTLTLDVQEGKISYLGEENDEKTLSVFTAFPTKTGDVLNLRDIEQGLEQVNRLSINKLKMKIAPTDKIGESDVILKNTVTGSPYKFVLSTDNKGSKVTGRYNIGLTALTENLLGLNDSISATYKRDFKYLNDESDTPWKSNNSLSFNYNMPFGYYLFNLNKSESLYELSVPSGNSFIRMNGISDTWKADLERYFFRNKTDKIKYKVGITTKDTETYIANSLVSVNSRKLSTVDFSINWNRLIQNSNTNLEFGISKGTKLFGALEDPSGLDSSLPKAQYLKYNLNMSLNKMFKLKESVFNLNSKITSQFTNDVLYGSEQIGIGGIDTVRGFSENSLAGDKGFYIRNDLSYMLNQKLIPGTVLPYLGLDYGKVIANSDGTVDGSIIGSALGLKYNFNKLNIDVCLTRALKMPSSFSDEDTSLFFNVMYTF